MRAFGPKESGGTMEEGARRTILLVEDEAIIAKAESLMLERNGYAVRTAYSGSNALEAIDRGSVDLVLMDIDLGRGMDGTEAAEKILGSRNLPILFLSSHTEPDIVEKTEGITSYGYVVKNSGEKVLLASIKMAFRLFEARIQNQRKTEELEAANARLERALAEQERIGRALKEREAEFRSLFDAVPAGVGMLKSRSFQNVNTEMCEIFGYSEAELVGERTRILYYDDGEYERVGRELYSPLKGSRRAMVEARLRRKDGVPVDVLIGASAIDPSSPDPMSSVACVLFDVTERKRAQDSLRVKDRLLVELFRACPECISVTTFEEGRFVEVNEASCRQLRYSREELLGRTVGELGIWCSGQDRDAAVRRLKAGEMVRNFETRHRVKGGAEIDVLMSMTTVEIDRQSYIISFVMDISERKRMEEALGASLREKDILLHELQHRIKNSLAMIASMASLEMGRVGDERLRGILGNLKDRIQSLSALYELLLKSGQAGEVDLGEYLKSIVASLSDTYAGEGRVVSIEQSIEEMPMDLKGAVPWGLIVNELATNALKYAFPSGDPGVIRIGLSKSNGTIELSVSDDGIGLPEGFDEASSGGMGLDIVRMMSAQLRGTLSRSGGKGTTFVVRAPEPAAD